MSAQPRPEPCAEHVSWTTRLRLVAMALSEAGMEDDAQQLLSAHSTEHIELILETARAFIPRFGRLNREDAGALIDLAREALLP